MKPKLTFIVVLLCSAVFYSCSDELDANEVRVEGTVTWISGGSGSTITTQAVEGATVAFYPAGSALRNKIGSTTTDSKGKFNFDMAPGTYDVIASKTGSTSSVPPPGSSSKKITVPESQAGKTFDIGSFLYK